MNFDDSIPLNVNKRLVEGSLRQLASDFGSDVLSLPIYSYAANRNKPLAYTSARGIYIREDILRDKPDCVHIAIAHEIWHHVVSNHRLTHRFSPSVVNRAEDYKINQLILRLYDYNIKDVAEGTLLNSKFDAMSIEQIATHLASKRIQGSGCGCLGLAHPTILKIAGILRHRYRNLLTLAPGLFHLDLVERGELLQALKPAYQGLRLYGLPQTSVERAFTGVWAHAYQQNPVAVQPPAGDLDIDQMLAYSFYGPSFRHLTVGNAAEAALAARFYFEEVNNDDYNLTARQEAADQRLKLLSSILKAKESGVRKRPDRFPLRYWRIRLPRLRKLVPQAQRRLKHLNSLPPIKKLIEEKPIQCLSQAVSTFRPISLSDSTWSGRTPDAKLPRMVRNPTLARLQIISRRAAHRLARTLEAAELIDEVFPLPPNPTPDKKPSSKPEPEEEEEEGEKEEEKEDTDFEGEEHEEEPDEPEETGSGEAEEDGDGKAGSGEAEEDGDDDEDEVGGGAAEENTSCPAAGKGQGKGAQSRIEALLDISAKVDALAEIIALMNEFNSLFSKNRSRRVRDNANADTRLAYGNDIERVLPSELALLANPATKMEFLTRYANHSLPMNMPPDNRRYPVVVLLDSSGSMNASRYRTAVGFVLALAKQLRQDNRGLVVVMFTHGIVKEINLMPGDPLDFDVLISFLMLRAHGGTNFDIPMLRAREIKMEQRWKHLLTIMISDGDCSFSRPEDINAAKTVEDKNIAVLVSGNRSELEKVFDEIYIAQRLDVLKLNLVRASKSIL